MSEAKIPLLVIIGPTGVGKSHLAIKVAQCIGGEIISGDSMQVYRGMDIGTAKVTPEEQQLVPHHLIDIRDLNEEYSVVDFCQEAKEKIYEIHSRGKVPIIAGGTGLYIQAFLEEYEFSDVCEDPDFRAVMEERAKQDPESLYQELVAKDPAIAAEIEPNNIRRVIRALENIEAGKSLSREKKEGWLEQAWVIGLNMERSAMYERINYRVESMIENGWIDECRGLLKSNVPLSQSALQAIGYKEIFSVLKNNENNHFLIEEIQKRTRNFAKRQVTWFRRMNYIDWFQVEMDTNWDVLCDEICENWKSKLV